MRIISGNLKGILIQPPKGLPVRPTTDRAKESLFNILENNFTFSKLRVLDLFAGTGNISYEFSSRGVAAVTAVDIHFKCIEFIKSMKQKHQIENLQIIKKDAFAYLRSCKEKFDIVFADAPYAHREIINIPELVFQNQILNADGWLIIEHETTLDLSHLPNYIQSRVYGQSCFSIFASK